MITATLNNRPLYAKGTMDVKCFDPSSNDMVYYSNKMSTSQIQSTINLGPINAGIGNPVVIQIPDTPSLTINLTAADFSLEGRALATGSTVTYNGVVPVDEVAAAEGTTLTVQQTPVPPLGGCDVVCTVGNDGKAYLVDAETRQVQGFEAVDGQSYCVHYWTVRAGAKQFSVETLMSPSLVRSFITIPVFSAESGSQNALNGSRVGSLYITIPRMQFNGDLSTDGSQTTPATTVMSGTALSYDEACEAGIQCGSTASPKLAYMVLELFGDPDQNATALVIVGGNEIDVEAGQTAPIPVKYVMDDGSLGTPIMSSLDFAVAEGGEAYASVSDMGVVTGISAGAAKITITTKSAKKLTVTADVTVSGGAAPPSTADVDFTLTTPVPNTKNTITGGGSDRDVAVNVASGTSSVVLTLTKATDQSIAVGGANAADVTPGGTDTAPTYTVNTTGGSKAFTLTVSEANQSDVNYSVTVTVA